MKDLGRVKGWVTKGGRLKKAVPKNRLNVVVAEKGCLGNKHSAATYGKMPSRVTLCVSLGTRLPSRCFVDIRKNVWRKALSKQAGNRTLHVFDMIATRPARAALREPVTVLPGVEERVRVKISALRALMTAAANQPGAVPGTATAAVIDRWRNPAKNRQYRRKIRRLRQRKRRRPPVSRQR